MPLSATFDDQDNLYVGDADEKFVLNDPAAWHELGVALEEHGKMPDVVVHDTARGWLVLIEAVTSHGPINPKRKEDLTRLFKDAKSGLVFVTAFLTRKAMIAYLDQISWETEVWVAEELRFPPEALALPQPVTFMALPVHLRDHSGAFCRLRPSHRCARFAL